MWVRAIRLHLSAAVLLGICGCATEIEAYDQVGLYADQGPELRRSSLHELTSNAALFGAHGVDAPREEQRADIVRTAALPDERSSERVR